MPKLHSKTDYFRLNAECFLAAPINAKGLLDTEDDVYIDCTYDGEITTTGLVEIAKNAHFSGKVKARACIIGGKLEGQVVVREEVVIQKSAIIDAEITADEIDIERGANLRGNISMKEIL